jgi:hypothetical protein
LLRELHDECQHVSFSKDIVEGLSGKIMSQTTATETDYLRRIEDSRKIRCASITHQINVNSGAFANTTLEATKQSQLIF